VIRVLLLFALLVARLAADEWPEHYIVAEGSRSPDGRYGILIRSNEDDGLPFDEDAWEATLKTNYIADLQAHRVVARVNNAYYAQGANRRNLEVRWAPDSSWCLAICEARFGIFSVQLLLPSRNGFEQVALGERVWQACSEKVPDAEMSFAFRQIVPGRLEVISSGTNNPKEFEDRQTRYVCFRGCFDLATRHWLKADAKEVTAAEHEAVSMQEFEVQEVPENELPQEKVERLDERLNRAYRALRVFLPREAFNALKQEQRVWLSETEKIKEVAARNQRVEARVVELERRFWSF
jgi:uncharacterized protein YecT (DUF1311 family)